MSDHTNHLFAVILAGGEGVRFAPLSTADTPKQFLHIIDANQTLLQQTFERVCRFVASDRVFFSTNQKYVSLVNQQIQNLVPHQIFAESFKKNTAPAIALACQTIYQQDPDAVVMVLPADHFMAQPDKATEVFSKACEFAYHHDQLVVFGVPPRFASSDYGYLECDQAKSADVYPVKRFVEKPDEATAETYWQQKNYYWNSGIFVWKAKVLLDAVADLMPDLRALLDQQKDFDTNTFFKLAPSISIDYAIMEKASNVSMFPFDVGWSDVGTWQGLADLAKQFKIDLPESVKKFLP